MYIVLYLVCIVIPKFIMRTIYIYNINMCVPVCAWIQYVWCLPSGEQCSRSGGGISPATAQPVHCSEEETGLPGGLREHREKTEPRASGGVGDTAGDCLRYRQSCECTDCEDVCNVCTVHVVQYVLYSTCCTDVLYSMCLHDTCAMCICTVHDVQYVFARYLYKCVRTTHVQCMFVQYLL